MSAARARALAYVFGEYYSIYFNARLAMYIENSTNFSSLIRFKNDAH